MSKEVLQRVDQQAEAPPRRGEEILLVGDGRAIATVLAARIDATDGVTCIHTEFCRRR